ncbi:MAG: DUF4783 domain-containing protein [Bacteroidales bacterium]|jgi:hypothetical protein|nr:DUF4783 domain-containing protein [Bacteroidales bacterium]
MKRRIWLSIALLVVSLAGQSQEPDKIPAGISLAFKAGNASELVRYLNSTVEILLLEKEDFYRKNAAEVVLRDFFTQYPVTDFVMKHQGSNNDVYFAIGSLTTGKNSFRVYFLLKKTPEGLLIHQIRIEPDNGG